MPNQLIRVGIVDANTLFRQGLRSLLNQYKDIKVVFEASDGEGMEIKDIGEVSTDVILIDSTSPAKEGLHAVAWLKKNYPDVKILAHGMQEEDESIIEVLRYGADGYIPKRKGSNELIAAIRRTVKTGFFLNEQITGKLLRRIQQDQPPGRSPLRELTQNELKFLGYCCSELTYKEIAVKMHLSPSTVENYREALFQKLSSKSRVGLVLYAIKSKLVDI